MKSTAIFAAAMLAGSSIVHAQQTTPPPVNNSAGGSGGNGDVMQPGANSFTEAQARERIEKAGYTNVTGLTKTSDGFWRGQAMKNGVQVRVTLDYKGNVTTL